MNHIFTIPKKYLEPLEHILEWHKRNYKDLEFKTRIKRLLDYLYSANKSTDKISIELDEKIYWYYIEGVLSDAKNYYQEIEVDKATICEIYDWANENYLQNK